MILIYIEEDLILYEMEQIDIINLLIKYKCK